MLFKGKIRLIKEVAKTRKGKIHTKLMYKDGMLIVIYHIQQYNSQN